MASSNVTWHQGELTREQRNEALGTRGATLWLTGLSGSGKSTVAAALERRLVLAGRGAYRLDGDNLRTGLNGDLGFRREEREENARSGRRGRLPLRRCRVGGDRGPDQPVRGFPAKSPRAPPAGRPPVRRGLHGRTGRPLCGPATRRVSMPRQPPEGSARLPAWTTPTRCPRPLTWSSSREPPSTPRSAQSQRLWNASKRSATDPDRPSADHWSGPFRSNHSPSPGNASSLSDRICQRANR